MMTMAPNLVIDTFKPTPVNSGSVPTGGMGGMMGGAGQVLKAASQSGPGTPMATMNDMANTGLGSLPGAGQQPVMQQPGAMPFEPAVVGPMLDRYRERYAAYQQNNPTTPLQNLGTQMPRPAIPQPAFPQPGGGLGGSIGGGFGNRINPGMQNRSVPDIAAQTVGETVAQSIESRLPQMSQGIGSLIGQTLLSNGGYQGAPQAQATGSKLKGMLGSLF